MGQMGEDIADWKYFLSIISKCTDDYLYIYDLSDDYAIYSSSITKDFELDVAEFSNAGRKLKDVIYPDDYEAVFNNISELQNGHISCHNMEYRWKSRKNGYVFISCRGQLVRRNGINYMIGRVSEIGKKNRYDNVTGIYTDLILDACVAKDTRTGDVLAVGESARRMIGRTPTGIEVIRPVQAGVIADYDMTEFMLKYFIRSVVPASRLMKTRIVVCVPSGITPVEKRAILEALLRTGAKKTVLIEEPLAAAMGTNLNEADKVGAMVVDIGGGTTDIAVLCDTGVVVSESLRIGGDSFNEAIIQYVRRKKKLVIGPLTAEEIKISAGTVDRRSEEREVEIRGRDVISGLPKIVTLHSLEIQRALESQVMSILEAIKSILEKTPPELVAAIGDHGIILTGGGALISGLDRVISRSVGIAAYLVELPRYAVIKGVAKTLDEMSSLRDTLEDLQ